MDIVKFHFYFILFYVYDCLAHMYIFVPCVYLVPVEVRHQTNPGAGVTNGVSCHVGAEN